MPTTRSASKKATSNSDNHKPDQNQPAKRSQSSKEDTRSPKQTKISTDPPSRKKPKLEKNSEPNPDEIEEKEGSSLSKEPILINRSPVLQLWAAIVAQFLHSELSWQACLNIGNSVSSLCAISKGKAIGVIEPKDEGADEAGKHESQAKREKDGSKFLAVMGFPMEIRDDAVLIKGKPKTLNEHALKHKFDAGGDDTSSSQSNYEMVKTTMEDALQSWKACKEELDKKAFHMYEKFRPNVSQGQSGWGRKGELNLEMVAKAIKK